jgi:hypothetical protein
VNNIDNVFFLELNLAGVVLGNQKDKVESFLLNPNTFLVNKIEDLINKEITQKSSEFDNMMHFQKLAQDTIYLFIQSHDEPLNKTQFDVAYLLKGLSFTVKNSQETLSHYLVQNYLGKSVSMTYYQTNSQEYLDKYLLEKEIKDSNATSSPKKLKL